MRLDVRSDVRGPVQAFHALRQDRKPIGQRLLYFVHPALCARLSDEMFFFLFFQYVSGMYSSSLNESLADGLFKIAIALLLSFLLHLVSLAIVATVLRLEAGGTQGASSTYFPLAKAHTLQIIVSGVFIPASTLYPFIRWTFSIGLVRVTVSWMLYETETFDEVRRNYCGSKGLSDLSLLSLSVSSFLP